MFTGIVREVGVVIAAGDEPAGRSLSVRAPETSARTKLGDSVTVNGCCLTASAIEDGVISFHAVPETISRTTLGLLSVEDLVNLEPALAVGDPLGGHYVQGHVDGVGHVQSIEAEGEGLRLVVEAPDDVLRYCVEKGSITVDGVSLTVAGLADDAFGVALVPHTLDVTTLAGLEPGKAVNLEVDVLAKYVERLLRARV